MPSLSRNRQFRTPLRVLFGVLSLLIVIAFVFYAYHSWQGIRREAATELKFISQLLSRTTDEVFSHHSSVLRILGERLREVDALHHPERGRQLVDELLQLNPEIAGFGLSRPDGQLVLVSAVSAGTELPSLMKQPESVESFRRALSSHGMVAGRTYYLPLLKRWLIPLRVAVRDAAGQVQMVMSLGIDIDSPYTTWSALKLPAGIQVRLLRPDGYWQFVKPLADEARGSTYYHPVEKALFDAVVQAARGPRGADEAVFLPGDYFAVSSWLPSRDLYTLVTRPAASLEALYRQRMVMPAVLFGSFLLTGFAFYRLALRQQREYELRLIYQAQYDSLTGLPNRLLVMDRLRQAMELASRSGQRVALAFVDLDHFKRINDSFGHMVGDELLHQCARRFEGALRAGDTVARLGGDEFLLVLPDVDDLDAVEVVMHKVQAVFAQPFHIGHREIFSTCSVGLALYPEDGGDADSLLKAADTALYKAKDAGRNRHCFYSEQMNREAARRMELESALRHALENGELGLVYQPQVELASGRWTGCEALLRWHSAQLGDISPAEFIPVAEESGLIRGIGAFVLDSACRDLALIRARVGEGFRMSINLSAAQLHQRTLAESIEGLLRKYELPVGELEFEITESMMLENSRQLEALHRLGVTIAVDDFGTGFSSLGYLQRFPVDTLKIDRSFVANIEQRPEEARLVRAIINLGNSLELDIVAEGIETEGQLRYLRGAGCLLGQGYYFSTALPLADLLDGLRTARSGGAQADG
ncbi:MAG TPA: EAL domain-containing protein [Gammaproteobacteria bacterium]|nr:EAL domain-containing protein [Gammaproteobacteria bacterium]